LLGWDLNFNQAYISEQMTDCWVGILSFNQACTSRQMIIELRHWILIKYVSRDKRLFGWDIKFSIKHVSRDKRLLGWDIKFQSSMYLGTSDYYWVGILSFNHVCISRQMVIGLRHWISIKYVSRNKRLFGWDTKFSIKYVSRDKWLRGWDIKFQSSMYLGTSDYYYYWVGILSFNQVCISRQMVIGLRHWISIKYVSRDKWFLGWNIEFQTSVYLGTNNCWVGILSFNQVCTSRQMMVGLRYEAFNQLCISGQMMSWSD
jgi:hypothetical protein